MRDFDSAVTRKRERPLLEDVCVYFGEVTIDIRFFGNGNGKKPRDKNQDHMLNQWQNTRVCVNFPSGVVGRLTQHATLVPYGGKNRKFTY